MRTSLLILSLVLFAVQAYANSSKSISELPPPCVTGSPTVTNGSRCGSGSVALAITSVPSGFVVRWYDSSGTTVLYTSDGSLTWNTPTISSTTTYKVAWYRVSDGCTSTLSTITATVNAPLSVNAGPDQTDAGTCGLTTVNLSASPSTGTWTSTGTGYSFGNTSSATTTFNGTAGSTYTLTWHATAGVDCNGTDDVVITFNRNPTPAPNAGADQAICGGATTASLSGNTPTLGTGRWSLAVDSSPGGSISPLNNASSTLTGTSGSFYGAVWTFTSGPCVLSDEAMITILPNPTTANAGPDQTSSATCNVTPVTLAANVPTVGTGSWNWISGPSPYSFGNTSNAVTTFTGVAGATYTLRWTITNGGCTPSTDDVVITFNQNPTPASAGPDQTGSTTCGQTVVTLAANSPTIGAGGWTKISGPATYSLGNASSPTSTFTGVNGGAYVLRWTISNSPCTSSADDVNITFNTIPNASASPATQTICSDATATITLTNPNSVAGTNFKWSKIISNANPPDVTSPGNSISGVYTNGDDVNQGYVTYSVTPYSSTCQGTPITAKVIVKDVPTRPNPGPQITYGNTAPLKFEILVPDSLEARWYIFPSTTPFYTGSSYTNSSLADPDTYSISFRQVASGCESGSAPITSERASLIPVSRVITEVVRVAGKVNATDVNALSDSTQKSVRYTYLDGLTRNVQSVLKNGAPSGKDLVVPVNYDKYGHTSRNYLPYADANASAYQATFRTKTAAFYSASGDKIANDSSPYDSTLFEGSPLGRVLEKGRVGQSWQPGSSGHTIKVKYSFNVLVDSVHVFTCDPLTAVTGGGKYYAANMLTRTETTNENGNKTIVFGDSEGRTVLKRQQYDGTINSVSVPFLDTYYVYDSFDNLRYIVPPGGVKAIQSAGWGVVNSTILGQHVHQVVYDYRGRITKMKTPGQDWTYYGYDKMDRAVLVQDGNTRTQNKWSFLKYDQQGRVVMTGFYTNNTQTTQSAVQHILDGQYSSGVWYETRGTMLMGYTNQSFPTQNADASAIEVMTVNYFDDYDFDFNGTADYTYDNTHLSGLPSSSGSYTRGFITGSKTKVVGTSASYLKDVVFYDNLGRPIQALNNNYLNATVADKGSVVYDFANKITAAKTFHNAGGSNQVTTVLTPGYDFRGKLNAVQHSINGATNTTLAKYEYNDLGQLVMKRLHNTGGSNYLQNVDYRYNIQGWLTSINNGQRTSDGNVTNGDANDFFGMDLLYEGVDSGVGNTPAYNGNITSIKWKGVEGVSGMKDQKSYNLNYDKTDKLTSASFKQSDSSGWAVNSDAFNEAMTYDHNGNILTLQRKWKNPSSNSVETMDNLTYTYASGNLLSKVEDSGGATVGFSDGVHTTTEYTYDANGNLTADGNKAISGITYNLLGKPQQVNFSDGRTITYKYDASGEKLKMAVTASGHTDSTTYVNGFVYTNGVLDFFGSPEGRVKKNGSSYEYQYNITDHQGNTRILFTSAVQKVKATFETASQATEATQFLNYPSSSGINPVNTNNHTPGGSKSQLLNGGSMGLVGVANSYAVLPGDTVTIEAYARYDASTGSSHLSEFATYLLAAFNLPAPAGGETGTASSAINSRGTLAAGGWGDGSTDSGHPKAFVNILIFDKNYNFLDVAYSQVTSSGSPAYITASYTIKEAGYAFAYISNENPTYTDVFFDDVTITWANHVIQSNEYYPFGLQTANSWTRDGNKNNFLFNEGSELNTTSGLYDLDYRNYDATLGRFFQVDPLAIYDHSLSPFVYARNSPQVNTDPSGLMVPAGWSDAQARALYRRVGTTYSGSYEDWILDADGGGAIGGGNGMGGGGGGSNGGYWETSYNATWVAGRNPRYEGSGLSRVTRDPGHWDFSETTVFVGGLDNNGSYEAGGEVVVGGGAAIGSVQTQGSGPDSLPIGQFTDGKSLKIKRTGNAYSGSAHYTEPIEYKSGFRYRTIRPNTTLNFVVRIPLVKGIFDKTKKPASKRMVQFMLARAFDLARGSLFNALEGTPNMNVEEANEEFKQFLAFYLVAVFGYAEVNSFPYLNINTFDVKFSFIPQ